MSDRVVALEARIRAVRKLANVNGTAMQRRLEKDIAYVEWLARNWLAQALACST